MTFSDAMILTRTVSSELAFSDKECRRLWDALAQIPPGGLVAEIGCQLGRTSSLILQAARARGFRSLHIDPWTSQPEYMAGWTRMMHSLDYPFMLFMGRTDQLTLREPLDLLLIDGDHTRHGVAIDAVFADTWVRPGGMLLAHDFGRDSLPDVWAILSQLDPEVWEALGTTDTLGAWRRK